MMDSRRQHPERSQPAPPRVVFWRGGSARVGGIGEASAHAHHAIQVCMGLERPLRVRGNGEPWLELAGAIITPGCVHALDTRGAPSAVLFLAPESRQGRQLLRSLGDAGLHPAPADWVHSNSPWLHASLRERWTEEVLAGRCRRALAELSGTTCEELDVEPRIQAVINWLEARGFARVTLGEAAATAGLSSERFRHLFVAQMGIPFRSYLLWARVQAATRAGITGSTWTQAAQEAGFADSAHLSRTFRRVFGLNPSMLSMPASWKE